MNKVRGFEVVSESVLANPQPASIENSLGGIEILMPKRSTVHAAGYDFFVQRDITLPPGEIVLIPTGLKVYMQGNEVLNIYDRSSNPVKKGIVLINSVGIVDSDYYGNDFNEGMICGLFKNITDKSVTLKRGDAFMQGVFQTYLLADGDTTSTVRTGGFGSTGN